MKYSKVFFPIVIIEEESGKKEVKLHSCARLFAISWIVACQAPPSMGFSRQEYGVGCHFLFQGIFPTQGLNPGRLHCRLTLYSFSHQGVYLVSERIMIRLLA